MITALNVSNNFLSKGFKEDIDITPMKLQKMLYFVYRDYLKKTNKCIFNDRFETWKYGPVIPEVYDTFKKYKARPIKKFHYEPDGKTALGVELSKAPIFEEVFNDVWDKCKGLSGTYLSNLTHKDGSAWKKAFEEGRIYLSDDDILKEEISIG